MVGFIICAESSTDHSSLSSATDNESLYSSSASLASEWDDDNVERFLLLSLDAEVLPYWFESDPSPEPSMNVSLVTQSEDEPSSTQIGKVKCLCA